MVKRDDCLGGWSSDCSDAVLGYMLLIYGSMAVWMALRSLRCKKSRGGYARCNQHAEVDSRP